MVSPYENFGSVFLLILYKNIVLSAHELQILKFSNQSIGFGISYAKQKASHIPKLPLVSMSYAFAHIYIFLSIIV